MSRRIRVALAAAALVLLPALGVAGCGAAERTSAADDVPALRASLSKVDHAMAARHYPAAQEALLQLIAEVRRARAAGDLDAAAARDILAAARALLAGLGVDAPAADPPTPAVGESPGNDATPRPTRTPRSESSPGPIPTPTSTPTSTPTPGPLPSEAPTSASSDPAGPGAPASSPGADGTTPSPSGAATQAATASTTANAP
ncbi:hypothetical protein [Nocardioides sp. SLBN-35]|uniref:hypothetical protein n=1 Tax=Nocardioides sp. SLBN-35 TaxID=2768445 RepID=UPI00115274AD|nr:hypothetical protein [Nocardioides sp. SLBN-35]